jgi:hypothetical protein
MQLDQVELAFANAMHQLDAGNGCCRSPEAFKAEHHVHLRLEVVVILFDLVMLEPHKRPKTGFWRKIDTIGFRALSKVTMPIAK